MKYGVLILLMFVSIAGWSQQLPFLFKGKVENSDLGKSEGGVQVAVVQNGSSVLTATTASNGKYTLKGNINYTIPFDVVFSKAGLVSKRVHFDLSKMNEEDVPPGDVRPVETLDMSLFQDRDNVDFSFLDSEPVASFDWNERQMSPRLDAVAASNMKAKISKLLLDAEKNKAKAEADYQQAMTEARAAEGEKDYKTAIEKYEKALSIKPKEPEPADKINELDALLQAQLAAELEQEQQDEEYNNLIKAADNLRDQDKLAEAISKYKEAATKKAEQYPKDEITRLTEILEQREKEAAAQAEYDAAVKAGDSFLKQNSLQAARDKYEQASKLKPSENYPKQKLKEIEEKLNAQQAEEEKRAKYDEAIAAADALYDAENWTDAKAKYEEALTFEGSSSYAKGRIALCDEKLASQQEEAEKLAKIQELLSAGDQAMSSEEYAAAKGKFEEVLSLDTENAEAKQKLATAEQKIQEASAAAEQQQAFDALLKEGDTAMSGDDYETALTKYEAAKAIQSTPEVDQKIADAKAKKAEVDALAEKAAEFQQLIDEGDNILMGGGGITGGGAAGDLTPDQLNQAKAKFEAAAKLDPSSDIPAKRIASIEEMLSDQQAVADRKAKYDKAIEEANTLFNEAKWEEAKAKYRDAMEFTDDNSYATGRVTEIDGIIAEEAADAKRQADIVKLMNEANSLYSAGDMDDAKDKYNEVLALDPSNTEASSQIEAINTALAAQKSEAEKEEAFNKLKEEGFKLADQHQYNEAKQKLQEALAMKADQEVMNRIEEINKTIAENTAQEELDAKYDQIISDAKSLESTNDFSGAMTKYQEAAALKPSETLPPSKIDELKAKIKNAQDQAAQAEVDEQYNKLIGEAQSLEANDDLTGAIAKYREALGVKPGESVPTNKIAELEGKITNAAAQEEVDKQYQELMEQGDQLMSNENYLDAITKFNQALALKPNEQEPVDKAAEAERLEKDKDKEVDVQYEKILTVAEKKLNEGNYDRAAELAERAAGLRPEDTRPKQLLERIQTLRQQEKQYADAMEAAESLEAKQKYSEAKAKYEEANRVRPEEQLPIDKIAEMQELIDKNASAAQKDALYDDYMSKGSMAQTKSKYDEALSNYQNALSVKPGDQQAKDKIAEIQQIIDDLENQNAADLERQNKYDEIIKEANEMFTATNYLGAKTKYEEALTVIPNDAYAKMRIDECVRLEREATTKEEEAQYQKLIKFADKSFDEEDWNKARERYERAVGLRSSDPYPKQKLAEIEAILNPAVVASPELGSLGIEWNGTFDEAAELLAQAEEERKLLNQVKAQEKFDNIESEEERRTAEKTQNHYDNSENIYEVYKAVSIDEGESDLGRQETVEAMKVVKYQRDDVDADNSSFEHSANVSDQDLLYVIDKEVAMDYGEREDVYRDNSEVMNTVEINVEDVQTVKSASNYGLNIDSDQGLKDVQITVAEVELDDLNERREVRNELDRASFEVSEFNKEARTDNYEELLDAQEELNIVQDRFDTKSIEDAAAVAVNVDELKTIGYQVDESEAVQVRTEQEHAYLTDAEIAEIKEVQTISFEGRDDNREEATEQLKDVNLLIDENELTDANTALDKRLDNKQYIEDSKQENQEVLKDEQAAHDVNVAYYQDVNLTIGNVNDRNELTDVEERLGMRKNVYDGYANVDTKAVEEADKKVVNDQILDDQKKVLNTANDDMAIGDDEKHLSNAGALDKIDGKKPEKTIVANALGEEYPEGVSQESFVNKDQNGLMKSIVTRRVVVVNGHANVYVRTQTAGNVTYSKNGKPTLAHVWNKETQDPSLERHY